MGELCVARPENHGFINIVSVDVSVAGSEVSLVGGQQQCVDLPVGAHEVGLTWLWDPRDPAPERVVSEALSVVVPEDGKAQVDVCFRQSLRYPDWSLQPAGTCPGSDWDPSRADPPSLP